MNKIKVEPHPIIGRSLFKASLSDSYNVGPDKRIDNEIHNTFMTLKDSKVDGKYYT